MARPKKTPRLPTDDSPECLQAWDAFLTEHGYPAFCTGALAKGYFSGGFQAGLRAAQQGVQPRETEDVEE